MSSVDQRVIDMQFNNQQFERGVRQSVSSLEDLRRGLDLEGATRGLSELDRAGRNFSLAGIASGIDTLVDRFSNLGVIGMSVINNLTNRVLNFADTMISALTVELPLQGYGDYIRKLTSVQTIMNATGRSIDNVATYFNQLDEYADKTIYNLDHMTGALAKFTNQGVSLDVAIPAIKGIANMTALAGQDANAAGIAFYNLAQSIGTGFLTTIDYKSLVLANVATKEWKQNMVDAAVAAGTLTKEANGLYKILGTGDVLTMQELFNQELSKGWASTEVMLKVFGDYGDATTAIGKKAQAAAQDVKDFRMMVDTLKASIGTGWTDTFEIILGNLYESKALFTPLSNAISDTIEKSTEARNSMLSFWKDAGGRSDLIIGIANTLTGLASVLEPIESAFRSIFPPLTGEMLVSFTKGFKDLTSTFKIGEETANNIHRTFKGLFAILDIGQQLLFAVGRGVLSIINYLLPAGQGILSFTGDIGDFIVALDKALKSSDVFNGSIKKFGEVLKPIADILKATIGTVSNLIMKLFSPDEMGFERIKDWIGGLISKFSSIPDTIANVLNQLIKNIAAALSNNDLNGVFGIINTGVFATILLGIKNFIESFRRMSGDGFMSKFSKILDGVRDSLGQLQATLRVSVLVGIAAAIGVLALSLIAIASIDPKRMESALGAISIMLMELFGSMLIFEKLMGGVGFASMGRITLSMIALSTAILVLSAAVSKLSKLDWSGLAKGLIGVATLSGILVGASKLLSAATPGLVTTSLGFIVLSTAIIVLSSAVEKLGAINLADLSKGLISVGILAASLSLFLKVTDLSGGGLIKSTGLIALAAAIGVLALSVSKFGSMDIKSLLKGLAGVGAILTQLGLFVTLTGNSSSILLTSAGLVVISGAMLILAKAVGMFGALAWSSIAKGLVTMAGALTAIGLAAKLFPANMALMSAELLIISGAMILLSNALVSLGAMSWESVAKSLVSLAGALTIVTTAITFMSGTLTGLATMVLVVASLQTFADVMSTLGSMPLKNVAIGLLAIAGVFGVLGLAGMLLAPLSPVLLELSGTIALFGLSLLTVSVNIFVFTASISLLIASVSFGVLTLTMFITAVSTLAGTIPYILENLVTGVLNAIAKLADGFDIVINGTEKMLTGVINFIVKMTPAIIAAVVKVLIKIIEVIGEFAPKLIEAGIDLMLALFKGISENIYDLTVLGADIVVGFIKAMETKSDLLIQTGISFIIKLINGMADGLRNNTDQLITATDNLIKAIIDAQVKIVYKLAPSVGKNIVEGMITGMKGALSDAKKAASDLGQSVLDSAKQSLGIHSPSKLFKDIGNNIVAGLTNGIKQDSKDAEKASEEMSTNIVKKSDKGAKDAQKKARDAAKKAFDTDTEWIDERKYYNQLSLSEELAAWERVQKKYSEGSEYRKKADREVYRVKKELVKAEEDAQKKKFENSKKWIDEEKYYNRLSLREELTAWERVQQQYAVGSEERKNADREVYRLKKEIEKADEEYFSKWVDDSNKKQVDEAKKTYSVLKGLVEDKRYYNQITLVEELELLKEIAKVDKLTAEDRKDNAREIYRVEQEIARLTKDTTKKIEDEKKKANDERLKMEDEYYSKVKEINDKLKKDSEDLLKTYNDALESRTKTLYSTYGLFDKVEKKETVTGQELIDNLQSQVSDLDQWQYQINQLSKKNIDVGLVTELQDMGPKSLEQIKALNNMSEGELSEYVSLWKKKHELAKNQALKELDGLRIETGKKLGELNSQSATDLESLKVVYDEKIKAIKDAALTEIETLKNEWIEKVGILKDDTEQKFIKMADGIQETMNTPEWTTIGGNIIDGIKTGIRSKTEELAKEAAEAAWRALQAAKDTLGIQSPSKEFAKVGMYSIDGFIKGIKNFSGNIVGAMNNMSDFAVYSLQNALSTIGDLVNGDVNLEPVIRPVIDLTDVKTGTDQINNMLSKHRGLNVSSINAKIPNMNPPVSAESITNEPTNGSSINFTQNNYSPKPLSRIEIYRQTKNQISTLKGLVRTV